jgi:hypothetical protein
MPHIEMIAAGLRFKDAWDARSLAGNQLAEIDIVEFHEAALGLMLATHTQDLQAALAVLSHFDPDSN